MTHIQFAIKELAMNETVEPVLTYQSKTMESGTVNYSQIVVPSPLSFKEQVAKTDIDRSFEPRWYQEKAVTKIFDYFYAGNGGQPLIVVPTGGGKSHIMAMFVSRIINSWADQKVLIISHVDKILEQDFLTLCKHIPKEKLGMYSASVGIKQRRQVTVAGIQSITKKPELFRMFNIILVDECHAIPHSREGQYRNFLKYFTCPVVGFTATHFRMGSGYLHEGENRLFTDIAYEVPVLTLIEQGFLCRLVTKETANEINTDNVPLQSGDFKKNILKEESTKNKLTQEICLELASYKQKYKKWLVFGIDIEHIEEIEDNLNVLGVSCGCVHSKKSKEENNRVLYAHHTGYLQALISVEKLTTGYDEPAIDLIALIRATQSPVLHVQMTGRGFRTHPSKKHCLILDFAKNFDRLGPINDIKIRRRRKGKGAAIMKTCPECKTKLPASTRFCTECNHEFIFKVNLSTETSTVAPIKEKEKITEKWFTVIRVDYKLHISKVSGNETLRVIYITSQRVFSEYVLFSGQGKNQFYCRWWWNKRVKGTLDPGKIPRTSSEAYRMCNVLKIPTRVLVQEGAKFPTVKEVSYE